MNVSGKGSGYAIWRPDAYRAPPLIALSRLARAAPWTICAITALAAALRWVELDDVAGNPFYDAAVRSMGSSWHNFFFGAFDPRAVLAVDKPPLDLWLQVASTKLLGWNLTSLKLPEVMGATAAVPVLYDAARRVAGRPAALGAAAALAVLPVSVLTARSDTMDSLMMLCVVAALWCVVRATELGSRGWLLLAAAWLGVAFNVKLFEALVAAPAIVVLYAAAPLPRRRRLADVTLASAMLILVSMAWIGVASLAPGRHPYVIGSADGSVFNGVFVFNGVSRAAGTLAPGSVSSSPGLLRLFTGGPGDLAALIGSMLVAALALAAAGFVAGLRRPGLGLCRRPQSAFGLMIVIWLALGIAAGSIVAVLHARYLEMFTPAVALAVGCGLAATIRALEHHPRRALLLLTSALACLSAYVSSLGAPGPIVAATTGLAAAAVAVACVALAAAPTRSARRRARATAGVLALGCCLAFPIHESVSVVHQGRSDSAGLPARSLRFVTALDRYLAPRTAGVPYELAAANTIELARLIIVRQRPILPLTSFGDRPLVGVSRLRALIAAGAVRYALLGTYPCRRAGAACIPAALWIRQHATRIPAAAWLPGVRWLALYHLPGGGGPAATTSPAAGSRQRGTNPLLSPRCRSAQPSVSAPPACSSWSRSFPASLPFRPLRAHDRAR